MIGKKLNNIQTNVRMSVSESQNETLHRDVKKESWFGSFDDLTQVPIPKDVLEPFYKYVENHDTSLATVLNQILLCAPWTEDALLKVVLNIPKAGLSHKNVDAVVNDAAEVLKATLIEYIEERNAGRRKRRKSSKKGNIKDV